MDVFNSQEEKSLPHFPFPPVPPRERIFSKRFVAVGHSKMRNSLMLVQTYSSASQGKRAVQACCRMHAQAFSFSYSTDVAPFFFFPHLALSSKTLTRPV